VRLDRKMYSGDNIGQQLILDPRDFIFQHEFLLFEALDLKLIRAHGLFKRKNRSVQIAMFLSQLRQRLSQQALIAVITHSDLKSISFGTGEAGATPSFGEGGPLRLSQLDLFI
jgi:hypothetical protein